MNYGLQTSVKLGGTDYDIRTDFRVVVGIMAALEDAELTDDEKAETALRLFYPELDSIPQELYQEAMDECLHFVSYSDTGQDKKVPKLVDWDRDIKFIVAPVNRILGFESRAVAYDFDSNSGGLHWHTFLSAYMEIGDCLFSQIVAIRSKKAKGKPLDKADREFYRQNKDIIDLPQNISEEENALIDMWTRKAAP